jgi:hypothetical protein
MRSCKYCGVELNDNDINCPLCGAHTFVVNATPVMPSGEYPNFTKKTSVKKLIKNIFLGIMAVILMAMGIASGLSNNWAFLAITGFTELYLWFGILQYVFYPKRVCDLINGVFFYIILALNLIFMHYYFNGHVNALRISLGYITPIILSILNITLVMLILITGKWHKYAYKTCRLAVFEFIWFIIMAILKMPIVSSIVCASLGFVTIVCAVVFGRETLFSELKKHFKI